MWMFCITQLKLALFLTVCAFGSFSKAKSVFCIYLFSSLTGWICVLSHDAHIICRNFSLISCPMPKAESHWLKIVVVWSKPTFGGLVTVPFFACLFCFAFCFCFCVRSCQYPHCVESSVPRRAESSVSCLRGIVSARFLRNHQCPLFAESSVSGFFCFFFFLRIRQCPLFADL